jgi:hypothetical protein
MTPEELKALLDAGTITEDQYNTMLPMAESYARQRELEDECEAFMAKCEAASLALKKKLLKEKAMDISIRAALTEDRFERKEKDRVARRLLWAARKSGGMSFG